MANIRKLHQEGKQTSQICIHTISMIARAWNLCSGTSTQGVKLLNQRVNAQTHRFVLTQSEGSQWALS